MHGKDVVVYLSESDEVIFHRLVVERRRRYLRPINARWQAVVIPLADDAHIVGVVVGTYADK